MRLSVICWRNGVPIGGERSRRKGESQSLRLEAARIPRDHERVTSEALRRRDNGVDS